MADSGAQQMRSATAALRLEIERAGYYPDLVSDALDIALAGEPVVASVVHHEPHFDRDELRRHVSVLVLTASRLVVGHVDEYPEDEAHPLPYASASTEAVPLARIDSVVVTRTVTAPDAYRSGDPAQEAVLTVGWGALSRLDLEPAGCGDPACEADHGYTGTSAADDLTLRVSAVAEGRDVVRRLLEFARALSAATAGR